MFLTTSTNPSQRPWSACWWRSSPRAEISCSTSDLPLRANGIQDAYDRLQGIGEWMKVNGEAIYSTRAVAP